MRHSEREGTGECDSREVKVSNLSFNKPFDLMDSSANEQSKTVKVERTRVPVRVFSG